MVDAHAHIFPFVKGAIAAGPTADAGYGSVRTGRDVARVLPPYNEQTLFTPEMLLANLDWAGVDKAVLLQGPFYGECNAYVGQAIARYPDRLSGLAYFDPWLPGDPAALERLLDSAPYKGLKLECSEATGLVGLHPGARLDAPGLAWLWRLLERRGLVLVIDLGAVGSASYQTGAARGIALGHPALKIVIPHLAQPTPRAEADPVLWAQWLEQVSLAGLPNVWLDTAALPAYLPGEDFPYPTAARYLRLAVEMLGAGKILWGSDQPGLLAHANYPQLVRLARLHTAFLTPADQALILGQNAAAVFGL
jgi:predicted TIM-barrel fold metal-dependent hydrolase